MRTAARVAVTPSVLAAALVAWVAAGGAGLGGFGVLGWLVRLGEPSYAAALAWLLAAPVLLLAAATALRRTPWPWVVTVTVHLLVLVALATRFRLLVPGQGWAVLGLVVVLGAGSVVATLSCRPHRVRTGAGPRG